MPGGPQDAIEERRLVGEAAEQEVGDAVLEPDVRHDPLHRREPARAPAPRTRRSSAAASAASPPQPVDGGRAQVIAVPAEIEAAHARSRPARSQRRRRARVARRRVAQRHPDAVRDERPARLARPARAKRAVKAVRAKAHRRRRPPTASRARPRSSRRPREGRRPSWSRNASSGCSVIPTATMLAVREFAGVAPTEEIDQLHGQAAVDHVGLFAPGRRGPWNKHVHQLVADGIRPSRDFQHDDGRRLPAEIGRQTALVGSPAPTPPGRDGASRLPPPLAADLRRLREGIREARAQRADEQHAQAAIVLYLALRRALPARLLRRHDPREQAVASRAPSSQRLGGDDGRYSHAVLAGRLSRRDPSAESRPTSSGQ